MCQRAECDCGRGLETLRLVLANTRPVPRKPMGLSLAGWECLRPRPCSSNALNPQWQRLVPPNLSISGKRTSQRQPLLCFLADSRESWRLWPHSTCKALKARRQQRHPANARLAASAAKAQVNLMFWLHIGTSHNLLGAALLSHTLARMSAKALAGCLPQLLPRLSRTKWAAVKLYQKSMPMRLSAPRQAARHLSVWPLQGKAPLSNSAVSIHSVLVR